MQPLEDPNFYDDEVVRLERRIDKLDSKEGLTVFYGSSSLRLWVHMKDDLQPMRTLNLAFGGSSFLWCIHHFDRLFTDLVPKEIVLYVGDNDLGSDIPGEEVFNRFLILKDLIWNKYPGLPIHFISIKPSPSRDYLIPVIKGVNGQILKEVSGHANMGYINIFDGMLDGHHPNTAYFLSDLLHLNRRGYLVWKDIVRKYFSLP